MQRTSLNCWSCGQSAAFVAVSRNLVTGHLYVGGRLALVNPALTYYSMKLRPAKSSSKGLLWTHRGLRARPARADPHRADAVDLPNSTYGVHSKLVMMSF
ncbi:hypothetical protein CY34DRAFT_254475 [Suillus luteus UH-Slu-Lm8-n1]|uniref:Uncharacterized protein n=1 Tax=Suillus luteus UH-Slu-Lm8-n1 TaxID=930992 RepID=A0A0C9ZSD1_9AGAM|nr:hypothetical protein CY34DRAFT_254475 [Suillus luteus UH-Slu-Lm8-n1]